MPEGIVSVARQSPALLEPVKIDIGALVLYPTVILVEDAPKKAVALSIPPASIQPSPTVIVPPGVYVAGISTFWKVGFTES